MYYRRDVFEHLCNMLGEAGFDYEDKGSHLIIPYAYSDEELLNNTEVKLIAKAWDSGLINIENWLIELNEEEQAELDPFIMQALLLSNYNNLICKYALAPYGLTNIVDLDVRNLQTGELESAIDSLLIGFKEYFTILQRWYQYIRVIKKLELKTSDIERHINQKQSDKMNAMEKQRGIVVRTLIGITRFGVKTGILTTIATLLGLPAQGLTSILEVAAGQLGSPAV